ncbi:MAG: integrase [Flavobacterium psychrophilum]|nr:MAG: integrase [Flavobacterium psychrophilum]
MSESVTIKQLETMKFNQTFSVLFWLFRKKENKQGLVPIYARITVDGLRAECSIKRTIDPTYWDSQKERANGAHPESSVLNEYITMVHAEISKHYNILLSTRDQVTADQVKENFLGLHLKKVERKYFMQHFSEYIKVLEDKVKVKDLSTGRFKRFKVLKGKCQAFIKHKYKADDILPSEMKLNFIVGFEHFLRTVQNIGHNTAMKYSKDLKQVMTYVTIEDDMPINTFQSFKATYKKVKRKFLTEEELAAIENKDISIQRLEEVRDCFIFSCYTGYAYSDAAALTRADIGKGIDGSQWILRDRGKTGEVENVPLLPKAVEIIEKYKNHPYCKVYNKLLPVNSNVRYNAYLKEIADLCGIQKRLTTHVARHTCATTVLLTNGVPLETAQEFLGHSDIRTTQIYAKVVQKKLSNDLNQLKDRMKAR